MTTKYTFPQEWQLQKDGISKYANSQVDTFDGSSWEINTNKNVLADDFASKNLPLFFCERIKPVIEKCVKKIWNVRGGG